MRISFPRRGKFFQCSHRRTQKRHAKQLCSACRRKNGAANGNRTRTVLRPRDFKSLVSTSSTMAAWKRPFVCGKYHTTKQAGRQDATSDRCSGRRVPGSYPETSQLLPGLWLSEPGGSGRRRWRILDCRPLILQCT